jgi:hypothetical protein
MKMVESQRSNTTLNGNDVATSSQQEQQEQLTRHHHYHDNLYSSKILEVSSLDEYLTSLLIGPSLSQIFQEVWTVFHTFTDILSNNNSNNDNNNDNNNKIMVLYNNRIKTILLCVSTILPTLIQSASWQATFVRAFTLLANQGTSLACHVMGLKVVENDDDDDKNNTHQPSSSSHQQSQASLTKLLLSLRRKSKFFFYIVLQTILPQIYQTIKQKHIYFDIASQQSNNNNNNNHDIDDDDDTVDHSVGENEEEDPLLSSSSSSNKKVLFPSRDTIILYNRAIQRRRFVLTKLFQWIDTFIPILRLGLLLNFWRITTISADNDNNNNNNSSNCKSKNNNRATAVPNLAMFLSGLAHHVATNTTTPPTCAVTTSTSAMTPTATTTSSSSSITHPGFFVLYAYRRWVHQEMIPLLLWQMLVSPILGSVGETYHMIRRFIDGMTTRSVYSWVRRRRMLLLQPAVTQNDRQWSSSTNTGTTNETSQVFDSAGACDGGCALCDIPNMIVPYQIKDCGHVACYACLWDFLREQQLQQRLTLETRYGKYGGTTTTKEELQLHCPVCWEAIQWCSPLCI